MRLRSVYTWALIAVAACAVISLFVSFQMGLFALLFALVAWWVWENPEEGFLLFLIAAPLLPLFKYTHTIGTITLIKDVIILALFVRLFAWPLLTKQLPYRRNILFAPLLALGIWTVVALLSADALLVGVLRAREIALYALFYMAVLYLDHNHATMRRRLKWFIVSLGFVLFHAAYQYWFAQDSTVLRFNPARSVWIPRLSATFGHPSVFGHYLLLASALFGSLALCLKDRWRKLAAAGFLLLTPFVYLTYSRAVWLGWGIVVLIQLSFFIYHLSLPKERSRRLGGGEVLKWLAPAFILLLLSSAFFTPAGSFLRSTFNTTYASNQIRLDFLARLIAPMTNIDAIIGRGLGDVTAQNFREVELATIDIASGQSRNIQLAKDSTLVDNQYLKTFVEMGLVGLLIYLWIYWRILRYSLAAILNFSANSADPPYWRAIFKIIGLASLTFISAFIIQAFFVDAWDVFPTNAYFWTLAATLSACSPKLALGEQRTVHKSVRSI